MTKVIFFILFMYLFYLFAAPSPVCWNVRIDNGGAVIANRFDGRKWRFTWRNGATLYASEGHACVPTSLMDNLMCEPEEQHSRLNLPDLYCLAASRPLLVVFTQLTVLLLLDVFHSCALSRLYDRTVVTLAKLVPPYFSAAALTSIIIVNQSIATSWSNFWSDSGWPQPTAAYDHTWINVVVVFSLAIVVVQWAMLWNAFQRHNNGVPSIQYSGRKAVRNE
ncbi:hypothetical protein AAVH_03225 [Aphelenchoides avenae]|nr:hypothetical protein AAVH_03225 [Aphelenchus avenae]